MGNDTGKLADLVRKLLALATSSNEHEAAAAAAKAAALIERYNLDEAAIRAGEREEAKIVVGRGQPVPGSANAQVWGTALINSVAKANFCRMVWWNTRRSRVRQFEVIGREHNVLAVEYLITYLIREIERLADRAWDEQKQQDLRGWMTGAEKAQVARRFKTAFGHGAVSVLRGRLQAREQERSAETRALVVVQDKAVETRFKELYPKLGRGYGGTINSSSGYAAGQAAGGSISINAGVAGRGGAALALPGR